MSEVAISIQNLKKTYRVYKHPVYQLAGLLNSNWVPRTAYVENHALSDFSVEIKRGEKVGIIGKNGSGKSTLLKLISQRVQPTSGTLKLNGRVNALLELGTGFHPEFTGKENIFSALAYMGLTGREAEGKFDEIVRFSELEEFIDQPVRVYSTGMYMRLAFSIATSIAPEILLVDEALSVGDTYFTNKCLDRMKYLSADQSTTVIYVSHNIRSLLHLCDRIIWIDKGKIRGMGSPVEMLNDYDLFVREEEHKRMADQSRSAGLYLPELEKKQPQVGSGRARVNGVSLENEQGEEKHFFERGTALTVCFSYRLADDSKVTSFSAVVGITRHDGVLASITMLSVSDLQREGKVRVRFPRMLLNGGQYYVSILLYEMIDLHEGHTRYYVNDELLYDAKMRAYEFKVEGSYAIETSLMNHPADFSCSGGEKLTWLNPV